MLPFKPRFEFAVETQGTWKFRATGTYEECAALFESWLNVFEQHYRPEDISPSKRLVGFSNEPADVENSFGVVEHAPEPEQPEFDEDCD